MLDNQIFAEFITLLQPAIDAQFGLNPRILLMQKNQPTQQGTDSDPRVFVEKLPTHFYGFPRSDYDLPLPDPTNPNDPANDQIPEMTVQLELSIFQFSALVIQNPSNLNIPTADDVIRFVARRMQTDSIRLALRNAGLNVLRITDVRNPYFIDDRERFEAHPSFDVTLQHYESITDTVQRVNTWDVEIYPV